MRYLCVVALVFTTGCIPLEGERLTPMGDPGPWPGAYQPEVEETEAYAHNPKKKTGKTKRDRSDFWPNGPDGPFEDFIPVMSLNNVLPSDCLRISPDDEDRYVFAEKCLLKSKDRNILPNQCRVISRLKGGKLIPAFRARCMVQRGFSLSA